MLVMPDLTTDQRLNALENLHRNFQIVGGSNITVEGSLRHGFALCSTCPQVAGEEEGGGGIIVTTPPSPTGACCIDGDCSITTEDDCGGEYQGDDTTCDPNPCPSPPECCGLTEFPFGSPCSGISTDGKYGGYIITTFQLEVCASGNQAGHSGTETFQYNADCSESTTVCEGTLYRHPVGGSPCDCVINSDCSTTCDPPGCSAGFTGCCPGSYDIVTTYTGSTCTQTAILTGDDCTAEVDVTYEMIDFRCFNDVIGVCCSHYAGCLDDYPPDQCAELGPNYYWKDASCSPENPCPLLTGACCDTNVASCAISSESDCNGDNQIWLGVGTSCDDCPLV